MAGGHILPRQNGKGQRTADPMRRRQCGPIFTSSNACDVLPEHAPARIISAPLRYASLRIRYLIQLMPGNAQQFCACGHVGLLDQQVIAVEGRDDKNADPRFG